MAQLISACLACNKALGLISTIKENSALWWTLTYSQHLGDGGRKIINPSILSSLAPQQV